MNKMTLNEEKTAQLHFTLKSFTCNDATNHEKFLGAVIDSKLTWNEHISEVANKLSRQIYLFRSLNQIVSISLSSLYVYRCLEYVVQKRSSVDRAQDVHQHDTRHKTNLYLPCHRLTKSIKHFEYLSPKFYNAIERTVREQPTKIFLAIVKNFLINPII
jgi:hypothetical protein